MNKMTDYKNFLHSLYDEAEKIDIIEWKRRILTAGDFGDMSAGGPGGT